MDFGRISELLRPFLQPSKSLSLLQLESILIYINTLARWNKQTNLTSINDPEEVVTRHFGESLFAARHLFPHLGVNRQVVDIGAGAGFPGLPLKIYDQSISLTLVESKNKKATFLREVIRTLHLNSASVYCGRAENLTHGTADIVTLRAVERFENVLLVAMNILRQGGTIGLLIGDKQVEEATRLTGVEWEHPRSVPLSNNRVFLSGKRF